MIGPKHNLVPLENRPAFASIPLWVDLACFFATPLVVWWLRRRDVRLMARVSSLLSKCRKCASRNELEALLGQPHYALRGHLFKSGEQSPDVVESYSRNGCRIEVSFLNDELWQISGWPDWTPLSIVGSRLTSRST